MSSHQISKNEVDLNYCSDRKKALPFTGTDAKPLPKMTLDGQIVEFMPGDTIMQVAERAGLAAQIPRYCYHPGLSIAGTCRMCMVEVEKAPKLMTACSTPAADGMVVRTRSEKVLKGRAGVMDCLLSNHPLDCPVCDKAGECELQDYDYEYGPSRSAFTEEKRVFTKSSTRHLSDKIVLNMNRCVACERCVRFTDEVTKTNDLVMLNRGWKKELTVGEEEKGLFNEYQGCLSDFCPVGALTWSDFRFQKRVWFLRHDASICDRCSKGCNIEVHSEKEIIYRYIPVYNQLVNKHWMCDEGRLSYKTVTNSRRVIAPLLNVAGHGPIATSWETLVPATTAIFKNASKVLLVVGTAATQEECESLKNFFTKL
ncbi:MAG: 2Fe-2S iron-sulfur cluster-binding protein, partial [Bdellovibrionota bacterium]